MELQSKSLDKTVELGSRLGEGLSPGDVVSLVGPLGVGKTTLVRGIAKGMGLENYQVTSPSFVFAHIYDGTTPLYHIDLYRVEKADELPNIGIEEMLGSDGVAVVEWFDRFPAIWPGEKLEVRMEFGSQEERKIELQGSGNRARQLIDKLKDGS